MKKKFFMLPVMAMLLFLLPVVFLAKTAEAAEETGIGLIDSGACGEVSYDFYDEYNNYIFFQADKSVQYRLYKDGTMVIFGNGEMGDFETWNEGCSWYRMKDQMPWYDCRAKIKKLVVEEGVTSIGNAAFYGCKNLESIQWADSIEKVGDSAFYKCSSLKEVKLPSYVKEWGKFVFAECKGLKKASMDENFCFYVKYVEEGDLEYVNELTPTISYSDGIDMFSGCTSLEKIDIPKGVDILGSETFYNCKNLKRVTVRAKSFEFYGIKIFYGCKKLSEITLYAETIGHGYDGAFDGIPKGVTIYVQKGYVNKIKKQFKITKIDMSKIEIKPMK